MIRLVLVVGVVALAALIAALVARRRPQPPTQGGWPIPVQLDRSDFDRPEAPWLVAVFTAATCDTCAGVLARAGALASAEVAVMEIEVSRSAPLHKRYGIDAVPTLVVADAQGVVQASFVGPPDAAELWSTVASLRDAAARSESNGQT
ncbi:MAG: thioredoxin domain-containing protein [Acidimicrobiales bacterium]